MCCLGNQGVYTKEKCSACEPEVELEDSSIFIKTFRWASKTKVTSALTQFKQAITKKSTRGYCQKNVDNMKTVSNQRLCKGVNKNIGYYYRIEFPVCGTAKYAFQIPNDFG
jgi:hypothetical protein